MNLEAGETKRRRKLVVAFHCGYLGVPVEDMVDGEDDDHPQLVHKRLIDDVTKPSRVDRLLIRLRVKPVPYSDTDKAVAEVYAFIAEKYESGDDVILAAYESSTYPQAIRAALRLATHLADGTRPRVSSTTHLAHADEETGKRIPIHCVAVVTWTMIPSISSWNDELISRLPSGIANIVCCGRSLNYNIHSCSTTLGSSGSRTSREISVYLNGGEIKDVFKHATKHAIYYAPGRLPEWDQHEPAWTRVLSKPPGGTLDTLPLEMVGPVGMYRHELRNAHKNLSKKLIHRGDIVLNDHGHNLERAEDTVERLLIRPSQNRIAKEEYDLYDIIQYSPRSTRHVGIAINFACRAMSRVPSCAPINSLPPEILTQIFLLVSNDRPCRVFRQLNSNNRTFELHYPEYPDILVSVCSSWRHAAIACPSLWTHIDIALDHPLNPRLLARAKVCATRASKLPLDIHVSDIASEAEYRKWKKLSGHMMIDNSNIGVPNTQGLTLNSSTSDWTHSNLCNFDFLNKYQDGTVPIRSFELDAVVFGAAKGYHLAAITYFFTRCLPGAFTQYTTRIRNEDYEWDHMGFIQSTDDIPSTPEGLRLHLSSQFLENHWLRTRILRINGLCPPWASKAYHGLIELHIGEGVPELHQSQLIHILSSSPKLRVLRLEINIVGESRSPVPVLLEDLEILSLISSSWFSMGPFTPGFGLVPDTSKVLRFIATGPKPLQLTYFGFPGAPLADFMARSNVTRLFIRAWGAYDMIPIIRQCQVLQTLILWECGIDKKYEPNLGVPNCEEVRAGGIGSSALATRINNLYLAGFRRLCHEQLRGIVEKFWVQKLVIYGTDIWHEGKSSNSDSKEIESNLFAVTMCPIVRYFESEEITPDSNDWD